MLSLRWIHFYVIIISVLLCAGFSGWCFFISGSPETENIQFYQILGGVGAVGTVALIVYTIKYAKTKLSASKEQLS